MTKNIKQESHASTLMSSIKAAYNYYHTDSLSDPMLYGLSGHAFVIHITNGLGPCAPYTFNMDLFKELCKTNLGLELFADPGFISNDSDIESKRNSSSRIKEVLDDKHLVLLSSYEFQLITDYINNEFITTKPWDDTFSVTPNIKMNTLENIKDFMSYTTIKKHSKVEVKEAIINSIKYAIEFYNIEKSIDSGIGKHAYDFWLEKITEENAIAHGNWWTSTVWAESRLMASKYMLEIKEYLKNHTELDQLHKIFEESSVLLKNIADKSNQKNEKVEWIKKLKHNEEQTIKLLTKLI